MKNFNHRIRLLLVMDTYRLLAAAMLGPIYALFVEEIGGSLMDASLTFVIFNVASGVTSLAFGKAADSYKHPERLLAGARLLTALGYIGYIFVASTTQLFFTQIIIGIGIAASAPAFDGLFTVNADKHFEGREWGAWESMYYFSAATGALLGGVIVTNFGFDVMFVIMALLTTITIPLALSLPHTKK